MLNKNIDSPDDIEYLMPIYEFMAALKDERKFDEKSEANTLVFKNIEKFARKYMKYLKEKNVEFVPGNATRGFRNIRDMMVKRRKLVDGITIYKQHSYVLKR